MIRYSEISNLLRETSSLLEKKHSPYKRRSSLGPTGVPQEKEAPPPKNTRRVKERGHWDCKKTAPYVQVCKGRKEMKGRTKTVKIDRDYRLAYNKPYVVWRRKQPW